jgi:L-aminoadipate-semialdehyde dehydrogenase
VDYIHWRTSLLELTLSTSDHALFPLLHFVLDDLPTSTKSPRLDDSHVRKIIFNTSVKNVPMASLMPLYLGYLCHVGFLALPQGHNLPKLKEWEQVLKEAVKRSGN